MASLSQTTEQLLTKWEYVLEEAQERAYHNIQKFNKTPEDRIHRVSGISISFDHKTSTEQRSIQKALVDSHPSLRNLIMMEPPIWSHESTRDFAWTIKDYLDLYFNFYAMQIARIRENILRLENNA